MNAPIFAAAPLDLMHLMLFGGLGALFVEALKHARKLQGKQYPDAFELIVSLILIALGAGVAAVYHGEVRSMLIAVQIGAPAPAIIGAWASGSPPPRNRAVGNSSIRGREPFVMGSPEAAALKRRDVQSKVLQALRWNG